MLAAQLRSGRYAAGDRLPPLTELAVEFGVSNSTIREAVSALVHEGLLVSTQGRGTFVADVSQRRLTVALLLPSIFHRGLSEYNPGADISPHYVRSIEQEVRQAGANLLLKLDHMDEAIFRENVMSLIDSRVDGVLVYYAGGIEAADCLYRLTGAGIPVVLIDRRLDGAPFNLVTTDNAAAAEEATRFLLAAGAHGVCCLAPDFASGLEPVRDRTMGYVRAMAAQVMTPDVHVLHALDMDDWRHAFELICQRDRWPIGVLMTNAVIAVEFWRFLAQYNLPLERFLMAHFDETYVTMPPEVQVAKILQPLDTIGREAVRLLMRCIANRQEPHRQILLKAAVVPSDSLRERLNLMQQTSGVSV